MKRAFITLAAVVLLGAAAVYIRWPVAHIPTYDAKLVRLAETPEQGYCAGLVFWKTAGEGSGWQAAKCRAHFAHSKKYPSYVSLRIAQTYFCKGVQEMGFNGTLTDCRNILDSNGLWPTYSGGLSADWSQAHPYPKPQGPSIGY